MTSAKERVHKVYEFEQGRPKLLAEMNGTYAVVQVGSKARVMMYHGGNFDGHRYEVPIFMSFEDFKHLHMNELIREGADGRPMSKGSWWLKQPGRLQFKGLVFEPGGDPVIENCRNLWRGWGVEAIEAECDLFIRHIYEVIASGDGQLGDYVLNWIAYGIQNPARRAEIALTLRGIQGCGKGTVANALRVIYGFQHSRQISSSDQMIGRFNSLLESCCFLNADEAFWAGDKAGLGALKRMLTEPTNTIERKGLEPIDVKNCLKVMITSNEDWVYPAAEKERRLQVIDVSDAKAQDQSWFGPIHKQLTAGGYGGFLREMQRRELWDFTPRDIVWTEAFGDQQAQSLTPEDAWWVDLLDRAELPGALDENPHIAVSNGWIESDGDGREVKREGLYADAGRTSPALRRYSDHKLGAFLTKRNCVGTRVRVPDRAVHTNGRVRAWIFPQLDVARAAWVERFPGHTWSNDAEVWGDEGLKHSGP
jgi:hypothetical protein